MSWTNKESIAELERQRAEHRRKAVEHAEKVVEETIDKYKGQWIRTTRVVIFEGPAEKVYAQIGRSHQAPAQRNVGALGGGCQITFLQGPIEVIQPDELTTFGHDHGTFYGED